MKKLIKSNDWIYNKVLSIYYFFRRNNLFRKMKNRKKFNEYVSGLISKPGQKVFSLVEPNHGNLGDIALVHAHKEFIRKYFPEYNIIDIQSDEVDDYFGKLKKVIKHDDIIVLVGGGSIGDYYRDHEGKRVKIIKTFKNNRIVSFPQSIYFSDTPRGKKLLNKTIRAYESNNNLKLYARDEVSHKIMLECFPTTNVSLSPDIVLSLEYPSNFKRSGATLFLRNDLEGTINDSEKSLINEQFKKNFKDVVFSDTKIDASFERGEEVLALDKKIVEFQKSEIVITDRLHGMIFAAITSTPCIVINNYNHKIKSQFDWIKDLKYIKFCNKIEDLESIIKALEATEVVPYNLDLLSDSFSSIITNLTV